jgi:hypothetical protein
VCVCVCVGVCTCAHSYDLNDPGPPPAPSLFLSHKAPSAAAVTTCGPIVHHLNPEHVPPELLCPISHEVFVDPVTARDGHTYERAAIERWLQGSSRSPVSSEVFTDFTLVQSHMARAMIQRLAQEQERNGPARATAAADRVRVGDNAQPASGDDAARVGPACDVCGATHGRDADGRLKKCARCKLTWYCSAACQKKAWSTHRSKCTSTSA